MIENTFGKEIIPSNDTERLKALSRYHIMDTPTEASFDNIAKLATQIFKVPIALISLVDAERVFFKANVGMGKAKEANRGKSLCALSVLDNDVTVFEDALREPCLAANPNVVGDIGLRFYAGAPLKTHDGHLIGTLCVIDKNPRKFAESEKQILSNLAIAVMDQIELRLSALDELESQKLIAVKLKRQTEQYAALNEELASTNEALRLTYQEIANKESSFAAISDNIAQLAWIADSKGQVSWYNRRWYEFTGKTEEEMQGWGWRDVQHPDHVERVFNKVQTSFQEGKAWEDTFPLLGRNGEYRWFLSKAIPNKDEHGELVSWFGTNTDITEQLESERMLLDLNDRLNIAIDAGGFGYAEVTLATGEMRCNDTFKRCYGRKPDEAFTYAELFEAILPKYRENIEARISKANQQNSLYEAEYEVKWPDGSIHWIKAHGKPRYDEQGIPDRMVGIVEDITEQKNQVEQIRNLHAELSEQEENLRTAISSANLGTWHINPTTREFGASPRLKELFGYKTDDEMPYEAAVLQIADAYRDNVVKAVEEAITKGESYDLEYPIIGYHDKKIRWVRATGKLYVAENSSTGHFSGTVGDITDRKNEEQRKLDFIGIVSHELKSPLTSLKGFLQIMNIKAARSENNEFIELSEKAKKQADRMSALITGFLDVARMGESKIKLKLSKFDLADVIKAAEEESSAQVTTHIIIYHPVEYTPLEADRDKIEQVVINFVNNAVKYSPLGSTINVKCVSENGQAKISVTDEGMGIAKKDQRHIFDRFYRVESTETANISGFGIGLYICKAIIDQHHGNIGVESELGRGSCFWFDLPIYIEIKT